MAEHNSTDSIPSPENEASAWSVIDFMPEHEAPEGNPDHDCTGEDDGEPSAE